MVKNPSIFLKRYWFNCHSLSWIWTWLKKTKEWVYVRKYGLKDRKHNLANCGDLAIDGNQRQNQKKIY